MELVSVIVPVYNAEQFLKRCVDSLLNQSYGNVEIVLVDDGSTDDSGKICNLYAEKNENVHVIHQENKGVTSARNHGIRECSGDFIAFVDSDDWIDEDFIEVAVNSFNNNSTADICVERMVLELSDGTVKPVGIIGEDHLFAREAAVEEMFRWTFFRWELCGKVYRARLFDNVQSDESIPICEDLDCNWMLFHKASYVFYTGKSAYHYFENSLSATHTGNYLYDTTLKVYDKILNSGCDVPYYVKMRLMRESITIIVKKIREMYFQAPDEYEKEINKFVVRLKELIVKFPDVPIINSELVKLICLDEEERNKVFLDEYGKICSAVERSKKYDQILIYGTGTVAEYIYRMYSVEEKGRVSFVVSNALFDMGHFFNRPVNRITDIEASDDTVIIMSIRNKIRAEIVENLKNQGFENIIEFDMRNIYQRI